MSSTPSPRGFALASPLKVDPLMHGCRLPSANPMDPTRLPDPSPQPNLVEDGSTFPARFWLLVVLTGAGAGLSGAGLMRLLYAVQHVAWSYEAGSFLAAVARTTPTHRFLVLVGAGLIAGLGQRLVRHMQKGHAGDLTEALAKRAGEMPTLPTFAGALVSIVIVGMGASLGREGALKKTGAAIASRLSAWAKMSPAQQRLLVACGAGAGMAAAYNVPFGGALFALEVLLGTLSISLVLPALTASLIATAVSWFFLSDHSTYTIPAFRAPTSLLVWALVAGPLFGLASAGYIQAIAWADRFKPRKWLAVAAPLAVFAALGGTAAWFPQLLGNGKSLVQEVFSDQVATDLVPLLLGLKLLAILGCLGSGAPGGLFTPTMTCGALLGSGLGSLWTRWWPGVPPASFALLGAGAVLAAVMQGPVSAIVMVLELTHQLDSGMVPLMLAVAGASLVTRLLERRSIYTVRVTPAGISPGQPATGEVSTQPVR